MTFFKNNLCYIEDFLGDITTVVQMMGFTSEGKETIVENEENA